MSAGIAAAAPTFDNANVAAGARTQLALRVPAAGGSNLRVIVHLMDGFVVDRCSSTSGWRCRIVLATQPPRTVLTFERADPALPPASDVVTFVARTPTEAATLRIEVDQFFADGHVVYWGGSTNKPPAILTVVAPPPSTAPAGATTTTVGADAPGSDAAGAGASNLLIALLVLALMLGVVIPVCVAGTKSDRGQ